MEEGGVTMGTVRVVIVLILTVWVLLPLNEKLAEWDNALWEWFVREKHWWNRKGR